MSYLPLRRSRALFLLLALLVPAAARAQDASRWFLAEGASNAVLEEEILVANPSASDLTVTVTLLPDPSAVIAPGAVLTRNFSLRATSRLTVRVAQDFPGLNGAAPPSRQRRYGTSNPKHAAHPI